MEGTEQWKNQLEQWKNQLEPWKNQATQWLNQGIEYCHQIPPTQLYAALAVLLFTTLFFLLSIALSLSLSLSYSLKPTVFSLSMFNIFSKSCMCNQWLLMFELLCVAVRLFKRAKSDTIVLTGLSGSGKTVLFYQVSTAIFFICVLEMCYFVKNLIIHCIHNKH